MVDLTYILWVDGLTKYYGRNIGVEGVSFEVDSGEIVGLLGPNGSGKSTTLHCLTGILSPTCGTVEIGSITSGSPPRMGSGSCPTTCRLPSRCARRR